MSNPRRMRIRRLDEFSLVDRPANPLATIVMTKRDNSQDQPTDDAIPLSLLAKVASALGFGRELVKDDKLAKRVKEMPDGRWMAMDDAGKELGMFDTEEEARAAAYGKKNQETNKMADETVTKADFEKMQERLTKAEADATAAKADAAAQAEKVQKLEAERKDAEFLKRAETYSPLPIKAEVFAPILRKAADVLTVEENAELDRVLTAAAEAMKASGLLKEIGSGSIEEGTAAAKVAAKVADLRKANPKLSEQVARAQVYKSDPALRKEVEKENAERAQAGR